MRKAEFNVSKEWDSLNNEEKSNVRRAVTEIAQITALWIMLQVISSGDKDPDRVWALKFAEYMLNREVHELGFLAPTPLMAQEAIKTVQSPFVVASALGDIAHVGVVATRELTNTHHPIGLAQNKLISEVGGGIANNTKRDLEEKLGKKVISNKNSLVDKYK